MKAISTAIAGATDAHATELILIAVLIILVIAFCYTHEQVLMTEIVTVVGGLLGIATKRALSTTNVANVEQAIVETAEKSEVKAIR